MKNMDNRIEKKAWSMSRILLGALCVGTLGVTLIGCPPNGLLLDVQQRVQEAQTGQTVATPQFSPAPTADGTYTSSTDFTVTITCDTSGAAIHYTTDGSTPSVSTTVYTGAIPVAGNGTSLVIKVVGTKSGMTDSSLAQGTYTVNYTRVSTPQFSPSAGTYSTDQSVTISTTTSGATIYYTTDGSTPTTSSTVYSAPISVTGPSATTTIKAYATKAGMSDSTVGSAAYTINYPTYKVTYDGNGASSGTAPVDSNSYIAGQTVTVFGYGSLSKTGNNYFSSWNTAPNGSGTKRLLGSTFAMGGADVTLYAQWLGDLLATDGVANDYFGYNVGVSSDGSTLVIGAYGKKIGSNSYQGAAYVFTKSGSSWSQAQKLIASDGAANDYFGGSVAASSDGSTLVIGAYSKKIGSNSGQGAVYVFTKSAGSWTQVGTSLTASDGAASDYFGYSISASSDGKMLVIGAYGKKIGSNSQQGAAYVFTYSGSSWSQTELTATDGVANDYFGYNVGVSSDSSTIVVGAWCKNTMQGAAYVFTKSGSSWNQTELTATDGAASDSFGWGVAASGDGSILLIGAGNKKIGSNSGQGAAYVFAKSGGSWSQMELTATDGAANDGFGRSVAALNNGSILLIGAYAKNSQQGAAYMFTKSGSSWSQTELTATDGAAVNYFGCSVAASDDGSILLIGAYYKTIGSNFAQGAAYVF